MAAGAFVLITCHVMCGSVWECVRVWGGEMVPCPRCPSVSLAFSLSLCLSLAFSLSLSLSLSLSSILSEYGQDTEGRGTHQLLVQDYWTTGLLIPPSLLAHNRNLALRCEGWGGQVPG